MKVKKLILFSVLGVNFLAIAALLAAYLSVFISPGKIWQPAFLGLAYPYILLLNIAFVVFWILVKWKYMFFSLLAIIIGSHFVFRCYQFQGKQADGTNVKVLSYNVKHFSGEGKGDRKDNAEKIVRFLEEQNADIICLQESRLRRNNIFNLSQTVKELKNIQHYQFASASKSYGSVTMTRYPIVNMGEIRFENSTNISIYTDVLIGKDTVRIYNLHLQSYQIDPDNFDSLESMDIQDENNRKILRKVASQMKRAFVLRSGQVEKIREHIKACKYPLLVCGDFNDTPVSYSYHVLSQGLKDAFVESGKGVGQTYVGKLPSFRIDYILYGPQFESYNFETIDFVYSDHLPVVSDFVLDLND